MKRKKLLVKRGVIDSVLSYSRAAYPEEGILLLRGRVSKDTITVNEVLIPPFATHAQSFSSFPTHMLPLDLSILGIAHSHPSGSVRPSIEDLNNFYGKLMVIAGYPFESEEDFAVFDKDGNRAEYTII